MAIVQTEAVRKPRQKFADRGGIELVSDGELLARFAADRDELAEAAFVVLVRRHGSMVLRVCRQVVGDRHSAEDAFQATFLVLARKAGSIDQPELLGHWLHGVALRTAREARMRDLRRRRRETPRVAGDAAEPIGEHGRPELSLVRREEFEAVHDEVARLPERYRAPIVLCDLEGLSYQEAAHRLRCPVGTLGVRLKRARQRLRARLIHRGIAPTAGLIGAMVGADAASANMSSVLVDSTVQAALEFTVKKAATSGLATAAVVALTERVLRTMALTRLSGALPIALVVLITATIGWVGVHRAAIVRPAPSQLTAEPAGETPTVVAPVVAELIAPQSRTERAPSEDPVGAAFGMPASFTPAASSPSTADTTVTDALFRQSRQREEAIAKVSRAEPARPSTNASTTANRGSAIERARGETLFAKEWVPNDPMSRGGDGLGPVYNDTSCVACHGLGAPGGAGPANKNVVLVTAVPNNCGPLQPLDTIHPGFRGSRSAVLHLNGTDSEYGSWRRHFVDPNHNPDQTPAPNKDEDTIQKRIRTIKEQIVPDNRAARRLANLPSVNGFSLSLAERNTPPLFGVGRIDEIPSEVLIAVAARQPADVRGRVGRTKVGRIGRFGWKAQLPSLHEFVRVACANELGLEVPAHPQAVSPLTPFKKARGLDLTEADCDALVSYVRDLPAPVVVDPAGPMGTADMREGRRLFAELDCVACHTPTLGTVGGIFSDLLLHDMGQGLSDSGSSYGLDGPDTPEAPSPREWRTAPLWGYRDSGPYLHDGRAENLEEAVALHDGQARASAHRFFALSSQERAQVEAFLKSLVAPAAAPSPGVVLAAEMEFRVDREATREPEDQVRRRREKAVAHDEQEWRDALHRRRALEAAKRARVQIPIAQSLEKMGKFTGALAFYKDIARLADGTEEGRLAAARIAALNETNR